jgi:hypothetical protein
MAEGTDNRTVADHDADLRQQPAPQRSDVREPPMSTTLVPPSYYVVKARGLRAPGVSDGRRRRGRHLCAGSLANDSHGRDRKSAAESHHDGAARARSGRAGMPAECRPRARLARLASWSPAPPDRA